MVIHIVVHFFPELSYVLQIVFIEEMGLFWDNGRKTTRQRDDDVVLRHTLPVFTGLGRCPIVNWDFAGAVSIFGPDALPVVHQ